MEIQKHIDNTKSALQNYKNLLPEIANLLNLSVSSLERYPTDIQKILCDIYINNYRSDDIALKEALAQVIKLNTETVSDIEQLEHKPSAVKKSDERQRTITEHQKSEQKEKQKYASSVFLTREQIIKNNKTTSNEIYSQYIHETIITEEQ